jgi:hypothetical protein
MAGSQPGRQEICETHAQNDSGLRNPHLYPHPPENHLRSEDLYKTGSLEQTGSGSFADNQFAQTTAKSTNPNVNKPERP